MSTSMSSRRRTERLEARLTLEEKQLIDTAVEATGTDRTSFVVSEVLLAAQRVLADQERYALDAEQSARWDELNSRAARPLAGLAELLERPSPFISS